MAVTKAKKIAQVETLAVELKDVSNGFIAEYGKLTVAQDDVLRKSIREAGAKYRVVKNTLAQRATVGTAFEDVAKALKGRTSIAYTQGRRRRPGQGTDQVRKGQSRAELQGWRGRGQGRRHQAD